LSQKRIQFSLRVLFFAIGLLAMSFWWFTLPTYQANRYVHAINSDQFEIADRMCSNPQSRFPGFFFPNGDYKSFHCRAELQPLSWQNLWRGTRDITTDFHACSITATGTGIEVEIWSP
jgi:hypothetical protein